MAMLIRKWDELPTDMQCVEVWKYYAVLLQHKSSLVFKRLFDIYVSLILIIVLVPIFLIIIIAIIVDSHGGAFFRQVRITSYGREFRIVKFRTMVENAEKLGAQVTTNHDIRITRVGEVLRRYRLDEIPQLFNILTGDMTFVGTRPEVPKYVKQYTPEMMATLLLPTGVTSLASIFYKNEAELLDEAEDLDKVYIEEVLPGKMNYNLKAIEHFSFWHDIKVMFMTVFAVLGKKYKGGYVVPKKESETAPFLQRG
jgi:lipopolysaccharide/colanic/teichoic acid biosynthesis glycosyltransferase